MEILMVSVTDVCIEPKFTFSEDAFNSTIAHIKGRTCVKIIQSDFHVYNNNIPLSVDVSDIISLFFIEFRHF